MRAAFEEGMAVQRDGESGRRGSVVRTSTRRASSSAAPPGAASTRRSDWFARASCLLGQLDCPRATVSEDLTWVLVFGDDAQRRTAVRLLERIGA